MLSDDHEPSFRAIETDQSPVRNKHVEMTSSPPKTPSSPPSSSWDILLQPPPQSPLSTPSPGVSRVHFVFYSLVGLLVFTFISAGIISNIDNIDYLDAWFLTVSACCCSGLSTISMAKLTLPSFTVLGILVVLFSTPSFASVPVAIRHFNMRRIRQAFLVREKGNEEAGMVLWGNAWTKFDLQARAVETLFYALTFYVYFWLIFGALALIGALQLRPNEPYLEDRGISREAQGVFIALSSFANAGFSLSNSSIYYWVDNPLAYCVAALLSLAGVTLAPVFIYFQLYCLLVMKRDLLKQKVDHIEELLEDGEKCCVLLFSYRKTVFLLFSSLAIFLALFLLSLFSIDSHPDYASTANIVGIGFYTAVSSRFTGLQLVEMNKFSRGMTVAYAFAFWIHSQPFLPAMEFLDVEDELKVVSRRSSFSALPDMKPTPRKKGESIYGSLASYLHFRFVNTETIVVTCFFILAFTEDSLCSTDTSSTFNLWSIFFEVISAHGGVGLSFSVPGQDYSFSGAFTPVGKLVIIFVTLAGMFREPPSQRSEQYWLDLFGKQQRKALGLLEMDD